MRRVPWHEGSEHSVAYGRLSPLLAPASVAVLGASRRRRMARTVVANLRRFGYRGRVYPVHPSEQSVEGLRCFSSIDQLPEAPDCVVIALSPENTLTAFRAAAELGVRAAVVLGSGFGEAGAAGLEIERELGAIAAAHGVVLCGPNCLGILAPEGGVTLTGYHVPDDLRAGHVVGILQSGSVFWSLAHNTRRIGFRWLVSTGNEIDLTANEYLDVAIDDPQTRLIVAFLETIRDGRRFLRAVARARARGLPVVVLKVGSSDLGQRSVVAHTGAMAGSDAVFDGICRQEGIIRVGTLDELYDTVEFLGAGRPPAGRRVGVVTDSGGEKTLIADWGERLGLEFPELADATARRLTTVLPPYVPVANPLDAWGSGDFEQVYPPALGALAADPNIDVVVLGTDLIRDTEEAALYARAMLDLQRETDKPLAVVTNQANGLDPAAVERLRAAGLPVLQGTEYGYRAIGNAASWEGRRRAARPEPDAVDERERAWVRDALRGRARPLNEVEARSLLARFGLPAPDERLVQDLDGARWAADRIGYPVVLKAIGAGLEHKTELGVVRVDLRTPGDLEAAWSVIASRLAGLDLPGPIDGMLVQRLAPPGLELLLGASLDPTFGPVIAVALGGVFVELLGDVAYRRAGLCRDDALQMLAELKGARLLYGFRDLPPRDVEGIVGALLALDRFARAAGDALAEVDINPLIVLEEGQGVLAVDALIVPAGAAPAR